MYALAVISQNRLVNESNWAKEVVSINNSLAENIKSFLPANATIRKVNGSLSKVVIPAGRGENDIKKRLNDLPNLIKTCSTEDLWSYVLGILDSKGVFHQRCLVMTTSEEFVAIYTTALERLDVQYKCKKHGKDWYITIISTEIRKIPINLMLDKVQVQKLEELSSKANKKAIPVSQDFITENDSIIKKLVSTAVLFKLRHGKTTTIKEDIYNKVMEIRQNGNVS